MSKEKPEEGDIFYHTIHREVFLLYKQRTGRFGSINNTEHEMWMQLNGGSMHSFTIDLNKGEGEASWHYFEENHYEYVGNIKALSFDIIELMETKLNKL